MGERRPGPGFPPIEIEGEHYGMADWSPKRHSSGWSKASLVSTPWPFKSIFERAGSYRAVLAEVSTRQRKFIFSRTRQH